MNRRQNKRLSAFSAVALTSLILVSAAGIGHAESEVEPALSSAMLATSQKTGPVFAPSEEAQFDEAFAPYSDPAGIELQDGAVDITQIEPAEPVTRALGTKMASYYGRRFQGRLTANGERFDMNGFSAAHKTLPFGTMLRVTNPRNGKSVVVRINDRGPFIRGRDLDLSRAAAEEIGLIQRGHGSVEVEIIES